MSCSEPSRIDQDKPTPCGAGDDTHIVITVTDAAFIAGMFIAAIALTALAIVLFMAL